jgi:hypothetical protein
MSSEPLPIHVRPALEADAAFIFNSWLKSFRDSSFAAPVSNETYFTEQHKLIERLLKRCKVFIACEPQDHTNIYGWVCFEEHEGVFTLHYAYIKHNFRMLGIAKELLKESNHDFNSAGIFTHLTKSALRIHHKFNLMYHPYILSNYNDKSGV